MLDQYTEWWMVDTTKYRALEFFRVYREFLAVMDADRKNNLPCVGTSLVLRSNRRAFTDAE